MFTLFYLKAQPPLNSMKPSSAFNYIKLALIDWRATTPITEIGATLQLHTAYKFPATKLWRTVKILHGTLVAARYKPVCSYDGK
jgi:hypothetical protein